VSKTRKKQQKPQENAEIAAIPDADRTIGMPVVQGESEEIAEVSRTADTIPPELPPEVSPEPWHPPLDLPEKQKTPGQLRAAVQVDALLAESFALNDLSAETTQTGFSVPEVLETEAPISETEEPLPAVLTVNDEPRDPLLDVLPLPLLELPPIGSNWMVNPDVVLTVVAYGDTSGPCVDVVFTPTVRRVGGIVASYSEKGTRPVTQFNDGTLTRLTDWQGFESDRELPEQEQPRPVVGSFWADSTVVARSGVVEVLSHSVVAPGWANVRYRNRNGHDFDGVCPFSQFDTMIRIENWQGFEPVEFPPIGSYWRFAVGYTTIVRIANYDGGDVRPIVCDYVPAESSQMHFEPDRFADGSLIRLSDEQGAVFEMARSADLQPPKVDQRTALFDIEARATSIASELQCRPNHVAVLVDTVLQTVEQLCTLRSISQSSPVFAWLKEILDSHPGHIVSEGVAAALDGPLRNIVQLEVDRIARQFADEADAQAFYGVKSQSDASFEPNESNQQLSAAIDNMNSTLAELQKEIGRLDSRMDDIERARIAGENRKSKRYADAGKARRVPKAEALAGRRARDKTLRESKTRQALDDIGLQEQPVKRGRGRPPKNAGGPAAKPSKAPPAAVKRGRGRPPKNAGGPAAKPSKAPPAAVKRGRGRPPKAAQVGDVPRSFASTDLMNKIQKFIGKPNPKVQHLMSRIPSAHLSKFISAARRGMPAMDVMKLTTWTPGEQGAFAAWYFSDGPSAR
jgi:hypothetical protein